MKFPKFKRKKMQEIVYVIVDRLFISTEDDLRYLKFLLTGERVGGNVRPLRVSIGGIRKIDNTKFRVEILGTDYDTLNNYLDGFSGVTVCREYVKR